MCRSLKSTYLFYSFLLLLLLFAMALAVISNAVNFVGFYFSGESKLQVTSQRLNDNNWHKVHLRRDNRELIVTIDDGLGFGEFLSQI